MSISKLTINLFLSLIVLIVTIFIIELMAPYLFPHWGSPQRHLSETRVWRFDEMLGWAHLPSAEDMFVRDEFSVLVSTNSIGLRDKEYSRTPADKIKRILLLGDSFGWGLGVKKEQTIDALLEKKYKDVEIINAAVPGYGTDQQFLYLKNLGLSLRPDLVLLLFHPNDIYNNMNAEQYYYQKPFFKLNDQGLVLQNVPVPNRMTDELKRFVVTQTHFLRQVYLALSGIFLISETPKETVAAANSVTKALLMEIDQLTALHGVDFLIAGIPWNSKKENDHVKKYW